VITCVYRIKSKRVELESEGSIAVFYTSLQFPIPTPYENNDLWSESWKHIGEKTQL